MAAPAYRPFEHDGLYETLAAKRAEEPVFYCAEIDYWVVTRRADVETLLEDSRRFSAEIAAAPATPLTPEAADAIRAAGVGRSAQVACDPPDHGRIRKVAGRYLNMKRYHALEPDIRRLTQAALEAWRGRDEVDLVADLVYELPAHVLFLMLGVPPEDAATIKRWGDDRLNLIWGRPSPEQQVKGAQDLAAFWRYCAAMIEDRKTAPRDDYASWLLAHRDDGPLSDTEIVSLVFGLLLAGHETTTNLAANAFDQLLTHREAWEAIVAAPDLIPNAVEEVLRRAASVICWRRQAREAVEIAGVTVPAGAKILVALASANCDEAYWERGMAFDIRRPDARNHLSFGKGLHFCIGAPLARLELKVILEEVSAAYPDLALIDPSRRPAFVETISFRGPKSLPARPGVRRGGLAR